jgi:pyruvate dehydrogenase E2 component (dihydrolipoamide acetyltransferase)
VRAAALALRDLPELNASFVDGELRLHERVDVAIASNAGLVTPIVRDAARKSLAQISDEARDLIARARGPARAARVPGWHVHGLEPGDARRLNPPQVAILGVGRAHPLAIARDGSVVVERVSQLTLSADHRVVDGALGARLLGVIRARLEDPLTLLV